MNKKMTIIALLSVLLIAPATYAARIFLNGVDITELTDKTFSKVKTVRIDEKGDVHINAPQYEVKVLETGGKTDASSHSSEDANANGLAQKYFIASQGPAKKVQYELRVQINGVRRVTIGARRVTAIEEITEWLKKGQNVIRITAEKKIGPEGRASTSEADELSLLIGAGHVDKKVVKIDSLKATFKCNASTVNTFTREYRIYVK